MTAVSSMSEHKHSHEQWESSISRAIHAGRIDLVPGLLTLMALDGYGHEAESLRRAMTATLRLMAGGEQ